MLVSQLKGTVTNFFGADTYHGALCAMSLMNYLCDSGIPGMFHGTNEDEYNNMRVRCKVQQVEKEWWVWATYVNKKSMFLIDPITANYHISGKEPLIFEHFLWMAGKSPHIHRHGQQLWRRLSKIGYCMMDWGTCQCVIWKRWLLHSKFVIK